MAFTVALGALSTPTPAQSPHRAADALRAPPFAGTIVGTTGVDRMAMHALHLGSQGGNAPAECRRSGRQAAGQILGGLLGAWLGGLVAFRALDNPGGSDRKVKGDAGYTPNANTAYALGSWVGSAGGVFLAASPRSCGSFTKSFVFAGIPTLPLLLGRDEPYLPVLGVVLGAPAQALVATIAYPK